MDDIVYQDRSKPRDITICDYDSSSNKQVIPISINEAKKILGSLGFKIKISKSIFKIEIPSWRPDICEDVDIIEELIRIMEIAPRHEINIVFHNILNKIDQS